jgi:hypothetical protein
MRRLAVAYIAIMVFVLTGGGMAHAQRGEGGAQGIVPSATASPTGTMTPVFTSTATTTPEGTATETPPSTATQTPLDTSTPLATATFTAVATSTATSEPVETATETPAATATSEAEATATFTPVLTATATSSPEGTATETPTATATSVVEATATFTPVFTATATSSPEGTATETPTPTATEAVATATFTPISTVSATPEATATETPEATETRTSTPIPTATRTSTPVGTASQTPTPTTTPTQSSDARRFIARLLGENVVPPVNTDARGRAVFKLNKNNAQLRYDVFGRDDDGDIDGVVSIDIHCGASGVNGPSVVFLFGPDPSGASPMKRILAGGTVTPADVMPVPDSPECPGGIANFDELIAKMRAGQTYVDVHTLDHPAGEIRGQIQIFDI